MEKMVKFVFALLVSACILVSITVLSALVVREYNPNMDSPYKAVNVASEYTLKWENFLVELPEKAVETGKVLKVKVMGAKEVINNSMTEKEVQ